MTFTDEQQQAHRAAFINECRQKAWGAACHADFISASLADLLAQHEALENEDRTLHQELKTTDYATEENRNRRKAIQERRNDIPKTLGNLKKGILSGQQVLSTLFQSIDTNLALAAHAEAWSWKAVPPQS
jgi:hypothetical protein